MEYKLNEMCAWERQKAIFLLSVAEDLGMDLSGYGFVDVNPNSGYVYVWVEDYNFSLYMPINCELDKGDVYALWTNSDNGDEQETSIKGMNLKDIEEWVQEQEKTYREVDAA